MVVKKTGPGLNRFECMANGFRCTFNFDGRIFAGVKDCFSQYGMNEGSRDDEKSGISAKGNLFLNSFHMCFG
jgi:hypothetical protein